MKPKEVNIVPIRVKVINETDSGRNTEYHDNYTGEDMTRVQFVRKIKNGYYKNYHIRIIDGIETPCSNPDGSENNNLG